MQYSDLLTQIQNTSVGSAAIIFSGIVIVAVLLYGAYDFHKNGETLYNYKKDEKKDD